MAFRLGTAFVFAWLLAGPLVAEELKISGALVKLIDQLDVPAREPGTIVEMSVREGARVKADAVLGRIDDADARFAENRAKVELQIASHNAASDVAVRSAQRALATAESELKRAAEARQKLRDVVTETEIEKLRLAVDQARLAVEKAQQELAVSQLQRDLKKVEAEFAAVSISRRQATAPFPGVVVQIHKHVVSCFASSGWTACASKPIWKRRASRRIWKGSPSRWPSKGKGQPRSIGAS
jgi:multidrug efflux pump subunit AcrA (membrane-fusion protein)